MPCVRCAFGFARYIFLELSTIYVTMSYIFLECVCYESIATVGEIRVWWRADFQSGSRVLKKVF